MSIHLGAVGRPFWEYLILKSIFLILQFILVNYLSVQLLSAV